MNVTNYHAQSNLTWKEALAHCQENGRSLISLHTMEESEKLRNWLLEWVLADDQVYIGW